MGTRVSLVLRPCGLHTPPSERVESGDEIRFPSFIYLTPGMGMGMSKHIQVEINICRDMKLQLLCEYNYFRIGHYTHAQLVIVHVTVKLHSRRRV